MSFCKTSKVWIVLIGIACLATTTMGATTIYVDDSASGMDIGTSWTNACTSLQDGIFFAVFSSPPVEILVAQGTYTPDRGIGINRYDRAVSFPLLDDVTIKGGYAGVGATNPDSRDIERYETILSGDLHNNDIAVQKAWFLADGDNRTDNSLHVVIAMEVDETAGIDGCTIRGGFANRENQEIGGGMANLGSSPKISNCIFEDNFAGTSSGNYIGFGGGMYNESSSPTIENCIFRKNCVGYNGSPFSSGAYGGGMFSYQGNPKLINCTFDRNVGFDSGAGMENFQCNPELTGCAFNANVTFGTGGAMYNRDSNIEMTNCLLTINVAGAAGGMFSDDCWLNLTNCTMSGNGGIFVGDTIICDSSNQASPSRIEMTNCIVWDSPNGIVNYDSSNIIVKYSNVQGGRSGTGNINVDPRLADPGVWNSNGTQNNVGDDIWVDGDCHLKSEFGRWNPAGENWVTDTQTSACIDAGDPVSPVGQEPASNGGIINMGAYGGTAEASKSCTDGGGDGDGDGDTSSDTLPTIVFLYSTDEASANSYKSLLEGGGATVSTLNISDLGDGSVSACDLIIVGTDTGSGGYWGSPFVAKVNNTGTPILGLGSGGYAFFGKLGLSIGNPNGVSGSEKSIALVDSNSSIFATPIHITIPESEVLELYTQTYCVGIELSSVPANVVTLGSLVDNSNVYPLVTEDGRYMLWGFMNSPDSMTQVGKDLFVNAVVYMASTD